MLASLVLVPAAQAAESTDELLAKLTRARSAEEVDLVALAQLTHTVTTSLLAERSGIERVQQLVRVPEAIEGQVTRRLGASFDRYSQSLSEFRSEASALQADVSSRTSLFRALMSGQRTCWNLDLYHQQIQTWGSGVGDLRAMLPSREACGRFRTAAFHPAVLTLVEEALTSSAKQAAEIRRLQDEAAELERLVEDLVEIEAQP